MISLCKTKTYLELFKLFKLLFKHNHLAVSVCPESSTPYSNHLSITTDMAEPHLAYTSFIVTTALQ